MHSQQHPHNDAHHHGPSHDVHDSPGRPSIGTRLRKGLHWGKSLLGLHSGEHGHGHDHSHDTLVSFANATEQGIWAIKWSFIGMMITALLQVIIVLFTGSVALLADTIHNFTDAGVTIPLWVAFLIARWGASRRFTYGLGRLEDLAGVVIVLAILFSAIFAGYESIQRLLHPQDINYLWAVVAASIIGFLGNEAVAIFRIRVGQRIGSAALVADGYHARVDGMTSLAVFFGAVGVWLGFPLADPIVGLLISAVILSILWQSGKAVLLRLLDGVDPEIIQDIRHAASHVPGVCAVTEVRARWLGHRLQAEVNITLDQDGNIGWGHEVAKEARHQLLHHLPNLSSVTIHVDPEHAPGEEHHTVAGHVHDGLPTHSHEASS